MDLYEPNHDTWAALAHELSFHRWAIEHAVAAAKRVTSHHRGFQMVQDFPPIAEPSLVRCNRALPDVRRKEWVA